MFIKNLSKTDLKYRANNRVIILPAGKTTHVDNALASAKDIKNAFLNHVDIITMESLDLDIPEELKDIITEDVLEDVFEQIEDPIDEDKKIENFIKENLGKRLEELSNEDIEFMEKHKDNVEEFKEFLSPPKKDNVKKQPSKKQNKKKNSQKKK